MNNPWVLELKVSYPGFEEDPSNDIIQVIGKTSVISLGFHSKYEKV